MEEQRARLTEWIGDASAVDWLLTYLSMCEFFDDLIDRDRTVRDRDVVEQLNYCMIRYATNPFWIQNYMVLAPQIALGIRHWLMANRLEKRATGEDLIWSYIYRQTSDLTMMVIELTRGREVADELELEIHDWAMKQPGADTYDEYRKEHTEQ